MTVQRRSRRKDDPVASLTVYRDHPGSVEGPEVAAVQAALAKLFSEDEFRVEHRAMVVDGETFVVFDVFRRDGESDRPPGPERRGSEQGWAF